MTSICINSAEGYNALNEDNPLAPIANLNGAYFDGAVFLESFGDSSTITLSYTHTISFWYKIGVGAPKSRTDTMPVITSEDNICYKTTLEIYMTYNSTIGYSDLIVSASGVNIAYVAGFTLEIPTHDDTWHHIAIYQKSYEEADSINTVYLDGVFQSGITNVTAFVADEQFAYYDYWAVGAGKKSETERFFGCLDEIYVTFDDFDISVAANLQKLINSITDKPVPLGVSGDLPTGNSAYIYLTDQGSSFANNYGVRSEPFIVQGTIDTCTSVFPDSEVDPDIEEP